MHGDILKYKIRKLFDVIKNQIVRVIPEAYRDDSDAMRTLYKWVLIGLLIRFIFMPFAAHGDLLSTYNRSYLILNGPTNPSFYTLVQLIQTAFLTIYQFILPLETLLTWPQNSFSAPTSHWLYIFIENHSVYRALFLFKVPYLFFDLASSIVFLHMLDDKWKGILAFKFWMINPIGIFAVYIFGRYETIPIFFILLSLYFAKKNKSYISLILLAVAVVERAYPLFFIPFYILAMGKDIKEKILLAFIGMSLFLFENIITTTSAPSYAKALTGSHFVNYIIGMRFDIGYGQTVYIFITAYIVLVLYYMHLQSKTFDDIWKFSLATLLLFYATSVFHPQYFAWFTPLIAIAINEYKNFLKIHAIQIICFIFYIFYWREALAGWLFASIDPHFFINISSPIETIDRFTPSMRLINMFRSVLSGTLIIMLWALLTQKNTEMGRGKNE